MLEDKNISKLQFAKEDDWQVITCKIETLLCVKLQFRNLLARTYCKVNNVCKIAL